MSCNSILSTSLEYVTVQVEAEVELGAQDVEMAFIRDADVLPSELDWWSASWGDRPGTVEILVGPGSSVDLTPGRWYVYVRIDSPPEKPVIFAGVFTVE